MKSYDLSDLDDQEFEIVCCKLLSSSSHRFERFKPGKDAGVDGRFFSPDVGEVVLQCKHWPRSRATQLIRALSKDEVAKATALKPGRYLLATSVSLNRSDKKRIKDAFIGLIREESDIYGREDLLDILSTKPEIIRDHPSLWLASAEVISLIENAAILGRSDFSLSEIRTRSIRYVKTHSYDVARDRLERFGVVLVTGIPGIGKSTLSEQLCLEYVLDGYQLIVIGRTIEEAEAVFDKSKRQIFYFDDFLGRNYLDALDRHEDSHIVRFFRRVQNDSLKRFILTSRTTVLNQAKIKTDQLTIAKVDLAELELRIEHLTPLDRAQILRKHIWHSDLPATALNQVLSQKRYRTVINHPSFNPRLIQFLFDAQRFDGPYNEAYWGYVEELLSNPKAIWEHVYDSQLNDFTRVLLLLCCYNGRRLREDQLHESYINFLDSRTGRTLSGDADYDRNIRMSTGAVLNRIIGRAADEVWYEIFNPSLADYVYGRVKSDPHLLADLVISLASYASIATIDAQISNGLIAKRVAAPLLSLTSHALLPRNDLPTELHLRLASLASELLPSHNGVRELLEERSTRLLQEIDHEFSDWNLFARFALLCQKHDLASVDLFVNVFSNFSRSFPDYDSLETMCKLYEKLPQRVQSDIEDELRETVLEVWEDAVDQAAISSGLFDEYLSEDDLPEAWEGALKFVEGILEQYPFRFRESEVEALAQLVDLSDIVSGNQRRRRRASNELLPPIATHGAIRPAEEEIDELFVMDIPVDRG